MLRNARPIGFAIGERFLRRLSTSVIMYRRLCLVVFSALLSFAAKAQTAPRFFANNPQALVSHGLFTTYQVGERLYWEIPDTLLGREFVVSLTVLTAPKPNPTAVPTGPNIDPIVAPSNGPIDLIVSNAPTATAFPT